MAEKNLNLIKDRSIKLQEIEQTQDQVTPKSFMTDYNGSGQSQRQRES